MEIEHIWCKIVVGKENNLVGCIYRPPNSSRDISYKINEAIMYAKLLVDKNVFNSLLIFGDFNFPNIE